MNVSWRSPAPRILTISALLFMLLCLIAILVRAELKTETVAVKYFHGEDWRSSSQTCSSSQDDETKSCVESVREDRKVPTPKSQQKVLGSTSRRQQMAEARQQVSRFNVFLWSVGITAFTFSIAVISRAALFLPRANWVAFTHRFSEASFLKWGYVNILQKFIPIGREREDHTLFRKLNQLFQELVSAVNTIEDAQKSIHVEVAPLVSEKISREDDAVHAVLPEGESKNLSGKPMTADDKRGFHEAVKPPQSTPGTSLHRNNRNNEETKTDELSKSSVNPKGREGMALELHDFSDVPPLTSGLRKIDKGKTRLEPSHHSPESSTENLDDGFDDGHFHAGPSQPRSGPTAHQPAAEKTSASRDGLAAQLERQPLTVTFSGKGLPEDVIPQQKSQEQERTSQTSSVEPRESDFAGSTVATAGTRMSFVESSDLSADESIEFFDAQFGKSLKRCDDSSPKKVDQAQELSTILKNVKGFSKTGFKLATPALSCMVVGFFECFRRTAASKPDREALCITNAVKQIFLKLETGFHAKEDHHKYDIDTADKALSKIFNETTTKDGNMNSHTEALSLILRQPVNKEAVKNTVDESRTPLVIVILPYQSSGTDESLMDQPRVLVELEEYLMIESTSEGTGEVTANFKVKNHIYHLAFACFESVKKPAMFINVMNIAGNFGESKERQRISALFDDTRQGFKFILGNSRIPRSLQWGEQTYKNPLLVYMREKQKMVPS